MPRSSRHLTRHVVAAVSLIAAVSAHAASDAIPPVDPEAVARGLGFNPADAERVLAGELLVNAVPETTEKELALAVWAATSNSVPQVFNDLRSDRVLSVDRELVGYGEIDLADVEGSLLALPLGPAEIEELRSARETGPLNLSRNELDAIAAAGSDDGIASAFRAALANRRHGDRRSS